MKTASRTEPVLNEMYADLLDRYGIHLLAWNRRPRIKGVVEQHVLHRSRQIASHLRSTRKGRATTRREHQIMLHMQRPVGPAAPGQISAAVASLVRTCPRFNGPACAQNGSGAVGDGMTEKRVRPEAGACPEHGRPIEGGMRGGNFDA